jgi:hypothetical protein
MYFRLCHHGLLDGQQLPIVEQITRKILHSLSLYRLFLLFLSRHCFQLLKTKESAECQNASIKVPIIKAKYNSTFYFSFNYLSFSTEEELQVTLDCSTETLL